MRLANAGTLALLLSNAETRASKDNEDVHTVNTNVRVVLKVKINVLINTETEVTSRREAGSGEFKILDSKSLLEDLLSELATKGNVASNFIVTTNAEGTNGDASYKKRKEKRGKMKCECVGNKAQ